MKFNLWFYLFSDNNKIDLSALTDKHLAFAFTGNIYCISFVAVA